LALAYITQGLTAAHYVFLSLAAANVVALGGLPTRVERSHNLHGIVITIVVVVTGDITYENYFACSNE
jgi:hypothetical protein